MTAAVWHGRGAAVAINGGQLIAVQLTEMLSADWDCADLGWPERELSKPASCELLSC